MNRVARESKHHWNEPRACDLCNCLLGNSYLILFSTLCLSRGTVFWFSQVDLLPSEPIEERLLWFESHKYTVSYFEEIWRVAIEIHSHLCWNSLWGLKVLNGGLFSGSRKRQLSVDEKAVTIYTLLPKVRHHPKQRVPLRSSTKSYAKIIQQAYLLVRTLQCPGSGLGWEWNIKVLQPSDYASSALWSIKCQLCFKKFCFLCWVLLGMLVTVPFILRRLGTS